MIIFLFLQKQNFLILIMSDNQQDSENIFILSSSIILGSGII
jgi:hypothetical protein